jgi:hypothetical protein
MAEFAPIFDVVFIPRIRVLAVEEESEGEAGETAARARVGQMCRPLLTELRELLVRALRPFDEARRAVVEVLLPWEERWGLAGAI